MTEHHAGFDEFAASRNALTPGPWHVVAYVDDARGPAIVSEDTPGAKYRITTNSQCVSYTVPRLPDARAIREVPTMVALLRTYIHAFAADHIAGHSGSDCFHCEARAVLARIEGRD